MHARLAPEGPRRALMNEERSSGVNPTAFPTGHEPSPFRHSPSMSSSESFGLISRSGQDVALVHRCAHHLRSEAECDQHAAIRAGRFLNRSPHPTDAKPIRTRLASVMPTAACASSIAWEFKAKPSRRITELQGPALAVTSRRAGISTTACDAALFPRRSSETSVYRQAARGHLDHLGPTGLTGAGCAPVPIRSPAQSR